MIYINTIGDRLRLLRQNSGLSQNEVGVQISKSKAAINAYEHDINIPPVDVVMKLANLYHSSADYILLNDKGQNITVDKLDEEKARMLLEIDCIVSRLLSLKSKGRSK